jgi:hypothetical protein
LVAALTNAVRRRPDYVLRTIGCFNPRCKKRIVRDAGGHRRVIYRDGTNGTDMAASIHSWAAAVDINPDTNAFGESSFDMPNEFVDEFEKLGFVWGGRWSDLSRDAMHFQYAKGV